jgi:hypothetical protein
MRTDARGIVHTEPVETHRNGDGGALPVATMADEQNWDDWEQWLRARLDIERQTIIEGCAEGTAMIRAELEDTIAAQARRISELELKLATAIGAIDILRPGMPRVMGTYISDATYNYLDIVAMNGSSFVALKDRPGDCPGDGWQLLASAGRRGPKGERGLQGRTGAIGSTLRWLSFDSQCMALIVTLADGSQTTIPLKALFTDIKLDRKSYSVVLVTADGAELSFSLRELFQQFHEETRGG